MYEVFKIVKSNWDLINSSGQYLGLFLVAFIFLYMVDNKRNKMLFGYSTIALIILFSPFSANNIMTFWPEFQEYWYAFLLLPVIPVCAYVCTQAVMMPEKYKDKWIAFASLVLVAIVAGSLTNGNDNLVKVDNRAGVSDECLALIQAMNVPGEPVILCADDTVMESARAYTNVINEPYEVSLMNSSEEVAMSFYSSNLILLHDYMKQPELALGGIVTLSREANCNYLVLPYEADDRDAMTGGGYELLLETENYILYHDTGASVGY